MLVVPVVLWLAGTRALDFTTPPDAGRLEQVRQEARAGLKRAEMVLPASAELDYEVDKQPPRRIQTRRPAHLSDDDLNPPLDSFKQLASKGARHMIDLSRIAEKAGDRRRALLGWERVIDSCRADSKHSAAALAAVKRLREKTPPWSSANRPLPLRVCLSGPEAAAEKLGEALSRVEKDLAQASHGVLSVRAELTVIRPDPPKPAPKPVKGRRAPRAPRVTVPPITLCLGGGAENTRQTAKTTLGVTAASKPEAIHEELLRQVFRQAATALGKNKDFKAVAGLDKRESPLDALSYRITRLRWLELAENLNQEQETTGK